MHLENKLNKIKEILLTNEDLSFLAPLGEEGVEKLQRILDEYIHKNYEEQKPVYQTMAFTTGFLPNFIVAKIAQEMLNPYIVGQVTNYLTPKDAARIAQNFQLSYLAEVALYADRLHLSKITQELPFEMAYKIMKIMINKGYFARIGELADHLSENLLKRFLERFDNPEEVAKIMIHMENLNVIYAVFRTEKLTRVHSVTNALRDLGHSDLAEKIETHLY